MSKEFPVKRQDGQRSLLRRWFGEKKYNFYISAKMDIVKKIKWEGFLFDIDTMVGNSITVTAPEGMIVTCSTERGVFCAEFDFWKGVLTKDNIPMKISDQRMLEALTEDTGTGPDGKLTIMLNGPAEEDLYVALPQFNILSTVTARQGSLYNLLPGHPLGNPYYYIFPDDWPSPAVFPTTGEAGWYMHSEVNPKPFPDGDPDNDLYDYLTTLEVTINSFVGDNSKVGGRRGVLEQLVDSEEYRPPVFMQPLPVRSGFSVMVPVTGGYYPFDTITSRRYYATRMFSENGVVDYERYYLDEAVSGLASTTIKDDLLFGSDSSARPGGSFFFCREVESMPIIIHYIYYADKKYDGTTGTPETTWWEDNPAEQKYRFILLYNDTSTGIVSLIDSGQFISLMESASLHPDLFRIYGDIDYEYAEFVISQWFGRPNHNFSVPHDVVMFNDSDNVYTWNRHYPNVVINGSGIAQAAMVMPVESEVAGVRPTIYYIGKDADDEELDVFFCFCEKLEEPKEIMGISKGNPFLPADQWVSFALPEEGRLIYIKIVSPELLIGILEKEVETEPDIFEQVRFICYYNLVTWEVGSAIKFDISDSYDYYTDPGPGWYPTDPPPTEPFRASWDISLFGKGPHVASMMQQLSQPAVLPAMPVGPYSGYLSGLP